MTPDGSAADQELWHRAAAGDGEAFAAVYRRHADRIYGYCFRRTASWSTAQDLTSLVFLEAWRRRGEVSFDTEGSVIGWLFGVANNVVRNSQRAMRRHQLALQRLPMADSEPDFADDVDARIDDQRRMAGVLAALASLTDSDREVLALSAWSGLDQRQMADALGVPVGTVKSRLSRARERLRALSGDADPNVQNQPAVASREAPR